MKFRPRLPFAVLSLIALCASTPVARGATAATPAVQQRIQQELDRAASQLLTAPQAAALAYKAAYRLARAAGQDSAEAYTLLQIGRLEGRRDPAVGRRVLESALPIWRSRGDSVGVARTLAALADLDRQRGDLRRAMDGMEYAQRIAGNSPAAARILMGCASLDLEMDEPERYLHHLELASSRAQSARDPSLYSRITGQRARALAALGNARVARILIDEVTRAPGAARGELLLSRASIETAAGRLDLADTSIRRAAVTGGPPGFELLVLAQSAGLHWLKGDVLLASGLYDQLRARARAAGDRDLEADADLALGRLALASHEYAAARDWAIRALQMSAPAGRTTLQGPLLRGLGYLGESRLGEARRELIATRVDAIASGDAEVEAACEQALGDANALESRAETAFQSYAQASNSLVRAESQAWRHSTAPVPGWTTRESLVRRRLNLAMLDPSPRRSWQIQEEAIGRMLLDDLAGSPAARLLKRDPRERDAWRRQAEQAAALRDLAGAARSARADEVSHAADNLQSGMDERLRGDLRLHTGTPEEVRGALAANQGMITLSGAGDMACAWVITRDTLAFVPLGASSEIGSRPAGSPGDSTLSADQRLALRVAAALGPRARQILLIADRRLLGPALALQGGALAQIGALECGWAASAGCWVHNRTGSRLSAAGVVEIRPYPRDPADPPSPVLPPAAGTGKTSLALLRSTDGIRVPMASTAQAWLAAGSAAVALQVRGSEGALTDAWVAAFSKALARGETAAHAGLTATQSLRASHHEVGEPGLPAFVIYGEAFSARPARHSALVEPWVSALASASVLLALLYGAVLSRRGER